ncbi:MAG: hypothetical protein J7K34_02690 [Flavobacteriaceae bacterium]|nr:hypothetical protein [Flavobacteriaceae bacterium]
MTIIFIIGNQAVVIGDISFFYILKKIFFLSLLIVSVFVIHFIIRKNILTDDNSFAILFYILLFGIFPFSFSDGHILASNLILLFAFRRIYSLRSMLKLKEKIYDSAFWIGFASLFYVWSFLYLFLLFFAIFIFNKLSWKNILIPFIGWITPVFLFYTYLLFIDDLSFFNDYWKLPYRFEYYNYLDYKLLVPISFLIFFGLFAIPPITKKNLIAKIDFKSTWFVLLAHIVTALIIVLLAPIKNGSEFSFLFFPLSILYANYLQITEKNWLKELVIYNFFILLIVVYFL